MPSGNTSRYFVIGDLDGIMRFDHDGRVHYNDVERLIFLNEESEVEEKLRSELGTRLDMNGEEVDVVCDRIMIEYGIRNIFIL